MISWTDFQTLKCTPPPGAAAVSSAKSTLPSILPSSLQYNGTRCRVCPSCHRPPGHMHIHDHGYPAHLGVWRAVWFTVSRWRLTRGM